MRKLIRLLINWLGTTPDPYETLKVYSLSAALSDWTDYDWAMYRLAQCLGIVYPEQNFQTDTKHMWWSNHPIGNMMFDLLQYLENSGIVECRDHEKFGLQYRFRNKVRTIKQ